MRRGTSASTIKAVHVQELRTAENEARAALGMSSMTFTDAAIVPASTKVRLVHLQELRLGVK
jgi:hypothetical protein